MTHTDIFADEGGLPNGNYLRRFLSDKNGRKCLLYIITHLGYFSRQETEEQTHVRNAAVSLLEDIREKTGFTLSMDFKH